MASVVIIDNKTVISKQINTSNYPISRINEPIHNVRINEVLPFRIKITNIGIEGYSSTNAPPIGIAIVGINNYIL